MRRIFLIAAILAGLSGRADAHAVLQSAIPRAGGSASAVSELRLTFTEPLEAPFSRVILSRLDGAPMIAPKAQADQHDPKVLAVTLPRPLPPGRYKVEWRVVSVDTHHTHGSYQFTVAP
jgi:methionine-rich copper-binding protein CopC